MRDGIQHITRDRLAGRGPLDDSVSDITAGKEMPRLAVAPQMVLKDPRVRATDRDSIGGLGVLDVVEPVPERRRVIGVSGK
ncbi:hypothetical protein C437_15496 [Haloarcula vallismortis ATCC 29715]|uniref:Uncharacterized protein n=1 Tax=Haloarcula vallismortis ATCC 29715 TaxID=662477 RepID=M0IY96_HALVA|nr:hypothetical protein C437_15496 [Haloarcula vallismortis ATCC 29715]